MTTSTSAASRLDPRDAALIDWIRSGPSPALEVALRPRSPGGGRISEAARLANGIPRHLCFLAHVALDYGRFPAGGPTEAEEARFEALQHAYRCGGGEEERGGGGWLLRLSPRMVFDPASGRSARRDGLRRAADAYLDGAARAASEGLLAEVEEEGRSEAARREREERKRGTRRRRKKALRSRRRDRDGDRPAPTSSGGSASASEKDSEEEEEEEDDDDDALDRGAAPSHPSARKEEKMSYLEMARLPDAGDASAPPPSTDDNDDVARLEERLRLQRRGHLELMQRMQLRAFIAETRATAALDRGRDLERQILDSTYPEVEATGAEAGRGRGSQPLRRADAPVGRGQEVSGRDALELKLRSHRRESLAMMQRVQLRTIMAESKAAAAEERSKQLERMLGEAGT